MTSSSLFLEENTSSSFFQDFDLQSAIFVCQMMEDTIFQVG